LGLLAPIVGHVGDGNFHVMPLIDANDTAERTRVQAFLDRLVERANRPHPSRDRIAPPVWFVNCLLVPGASAARATLRRVDRRQLTPAGCAT